MRRRDDGRWHLQHGPIDCIVGADGDAAAVAAAIERAGARFGGILDELVAELPLLRTDLGSSAGAAVQPSGPIARRMVAACRPHAAGGRFITAMAAVAGSVAEELIAFFDDPRIVRAYVNNGGDIALHLGPGAAFEIGWIADTDAPLRERADAMLRRHVDPALHDLSGHGSRGASIDGSFCITAASGVRGVATSGWRGRSFSLGIADSVTVLAATAAQADAAATVIANAVDVDDGLIQRKPASQCKDDSDLGDTLVTVDVPPLAPSQVKSALDTGAICAKVLQKGGLVWAALLVCQGQFRLVEPLCSKPLQTVLPKTVGSVFA